MIRWKQRIRKGQYIIVDVLLLIIAFIGADLIGYYFLGMPATNELESALFIILMILLFLSLFISTGIYDQAIRANGVIEFTLALKTASLMAIGVIIFSAVMYLLKQNAIEPKLILTYYIVACVMITLSRMVMRVIYRRTNSNGKLVKKILIVGHSDRGVKYLEYMKKHEYLNMKVMGYISIKNPQNYEGLQHLGELTDLVDIAKKYVIDEIAVARPLSYDSRLNALLDQCQTMGITLTMLLECQNTGNAKAQVAMYGAMPALKFHTVSLNESQILAKRILDVIGSSVGLVLFGLFYIIVGPLIKLETPGPIIFKQDRVGCNGRVFKIWKFRSMGVNAESQKAALMANNEMSGHMFKISGDPRITKVGAFIRKTSIDELPQFWNVFKGDMSLVGTRPPTVGEVKEYETHHRRRICITPGITGKWQVSGRSDIDDFEEVVRLDSEYIESWTIWEDVKILLKTIIVVFKKDGSR